MQPLPEGTITILFTDVVGSTDLTSRLGDDASHDLLNTQRDAVRQQVLAHKGQEIKSLGDGFMIGFASARRAVACAVAIQRSIAEQNASRPPDGQLELRIGLNSGEAIQEDGDLFGDAVNAAARIAARAEGGQILISNAVKGILGRSRDIELVDRGRVSLKGFPDRCRLFEVEWRRKITTAGPGIERTPFVGRANERAQMAALLNDAAARKGRIVLLGGEPGVGKTRLALETAEEAQRRGFLAFVGHCHEGDNTPYAPFIEMIESAARRFPPQALHAVLGDATPEIIRLVPELRRLFPDTPPSPEMPPEQERRYIFNAVRSFVARGATAQPLLLIAEDLHWADDSTLQLLTHLSQNLSQIAVSVIGTYRDAEVGPALTGTLNDIIRLRSGALMPLKRLPEGEMTAMLRALAGQDAPSPVVQLIYQQTEGNPFFVEEVFKHLREEGKLFGDDGKWRAEIQPGEVDVPEGVRLVIGWRLLKVSEECRQALTSAAVIGRGFSFDLLEAMADLTADQILDALDEAVRAQLVVESPGDVDAPFVFAHELVRQTLVGLVSGARRQRLHLRTADAIERVYGSSPERAGDIAHHLLSAGSAAASERTARYLLLAGERALESVAFVEADRLFASALEVLPADGSALYADLLFRRGWALRSLGRWDEALDVWRETLGSYEELGDAESVGRLAAEITQQLLWAYRFPEALEMTRRGMAALGEAPTPDRCRLQAAAALALSAAGSYAISRSMLASAVELAEQIGDRRLLGQVLGYKTVHHWCFTQAREGVEAARRAADLSRECGDLWYLATGLGFYSQCLIFTGGLHELDGVLAELEPLANRLGHLGSVMNCNRSESWSRLMRSGQLSALEKSSLEDLEFCRNSGLPWMSVPYSRLAFAQFYQGRWEEALDTAAEAVVHEPAGFWRGLNSSREFLIQAHLGRRDPCLNALDRPGALPRKGESGTAGAQANLVIGTEALAFLGERERAAQLYPLVLDSLDDGMVAFAIWSLVMETVAGIAAACGDNWEAAERHFANALRQSRELPHRISEPETLRWYARMLLDRNGPGDRDRAREFLTQAAALYERFAMPRHVDLAKQMLGAS